jgi:hypothetical protein
VNSMPLLLSYNCFACLEVDTLIEPEICNIESKEVIHTISYPVMKVTYPPFCFFYSHTSNGFSAHGHNHTDINKYSFSTNPFCIQNEASSWPRWIRSNMISVL